MDPVEAKATSRIQRVWRMRWFRWMIRVVLFLFLLWCIRLPILRGMGNYLITEDPLVPVADVYVLGGASVDRGLEAARLYKHGMNAQFHFTGESVPQDLVAMGIATTEGQCAQRVAIEHGIPATRTDTIYHGTSTKEEADAILTHALQLHQDTIMIVSSSFHLRRIRYVFRKRFAAHGITVILHGSPSASFNTDEWWRHEDGLMMVNNEYVKLVWYWLHY